MRKQMYWTKNLSHTENILYVVIWVLLFAAPVMSTYVRTASDPMVTFSWQEMLMIWKKIAVYLVLFVIHHIFLAPLLIHQQRRVLYGSIVAVIVTAFTLYQCNTRPADLEPKHSHKTERRIPMHDDHRPGPPPRDFEHRPHDDRPIHTKDGEMRRHRPPSFIGEHDIVAVIILVLMFGMNLGVRLLFKTQRDQDKLVKLEKESLEQQLEYLKYQLNPHFLMNTLNNIHALVDIDAERSKDAIIELSKILRYVLYESNQERIPLYKEIDFMDNYVRLMRMRYSDKLDFRVENSDDVSNISVPPLLFISFVENAFKHGVSYQKESFIHITSKRLKGKRGEDRMRWTCRNSKHSKPQSNDMPKEGGVGMTNIRKRLSLIYGNDYTLDVNDGENTYEVILDIPLEA